MQAIETKYFGPTNFKGSRIRAKFMESGKSKTIHWDYELNPRENHEKAMEALSGESGGKWIGGGTKNGYVWVRKPGR